MSLNATCRELLKGNGISLLSSIDYMVNDQEYNFTYEYIIDTFLLSSQESSETFVEALRSVTEVSEEAVEKYFEQMGQLLLMTHLSEHSI